MISAIEDWLRVPLNYTKGVELYKLHGKSDLFKKVFSGAESSFTRDKLRQELLKINSEIEVKRPPSPKEKTPPLKDLTPMSDSKFVHIDVNALPKDLKEKNRHKNALFSQSKLLYEQLKEVRTDEARYPIAFQIVSNFKEQDEIWKELEDFQSTGKRKDSAKESPEDLRNLNGLELAMKLENLKKQYHKVNKKPEKKQQADDLLAKRREVEDALEQR